MGTAERFAKNAFWLLGAQAVSMAFNFFYITMTGRFLGADKFGTLTFALAFTGMFGAVIDTGIRKVLVRDLARDETLVEDYLGKILGLKIILAGAAYITIVYAVRALDYPELTIRIVRILGLALAADSITQNFFAVFQSRNDLRFEALGLCMRSIFLMAGSLFLIRSGRGVESFAFLYLIGSCGLLLFALSAYIRLFSVPWARFDIFFVKDKVRDSISFGLIGVFEVIYHWLDTVMLSLMKTDAAVGWYNAAYRLFLVTVTVPSALGVILFPIMSRQHVSSGETLGKTCERYFKYMSIFGVLQAALVAGFADRVVSIFFGPGYGPSVGALRILMLSSALIYVNSAFVKLFESSDRQTALAKVCGAAAALNVALNFLLIPGLGLTGASAATVSSELLITASVIFLASRTVYGLKLSKVLGQMLKTGVSGLFALVLAVSVQKALSATAAAVTLISIYFGMLFLVGLLDNDDLRYTKRVFVSIFARA